MKCRFGIDVLLQFSECSLIGVLLQVSECSLIYLTWEWHRKGIYYVGRVNRGVCKQENVKVIKKLLELINLWNLDNLCILLLRF